MPRSLVPSASVRWLYHNIPIEIVSDNSRTVDYVQKRYLYECTGAQEY